METWGQTTAEKKSSANEQLSISCSFHFIVSRTTRRFFLLAPSRVIDVVTETLKGVIGTHERPADLARGAQEAAQGFAAEIKNQTSASVEQAIDSVNEAIPDVTVQTLRSEGPGATERVKQTAQETWAKAKESAGLDVDTGGGRGAQAVTSETGGANAEERASMNATDETPMPPGPDASQTSEAPAPPVSKKDDPDWKTGGPVIQALELGALRCRTDVGFGTN